MSDSSVAEAITDHLDLPEATITDKLIWKVVGGAAVASTAYLARRALHAGWEGVFKNPPPTNPEHPDVQWREAVAWALVSGAVIGLAQLVTARNTAKYWRKRTGHLPPGLRDIG